MTGTLSGGFTFLSHPVVTSVNPASGTELGGTSMTIAGSNFQRGATVTFDDSTATHVVVVSSVTITAITPAHRVGTVDVTVTNPNGLSGTLFNGFEFIAAPPIVTFIIPASGLELGGTSVTIVGSNFLSGATVTFGDIAATDIVLLSSIITAVTPVHPAGTVDVIVTNPDNQADTLFNGFTFVPALFGLPTDYAVGNGPYSVFIADLDGDGDNDLAVANAFSFEVSILLNNGDGKFAGKVDYNIGNQPFSIFSADVDGDGDNDLITANLFSDNVSVLLNNGDGTFAGKMDYVAGTDPYSVFIADLDGDGDNDLAVANNGSGNVSVLLNNGDGTFAGKMDYVAGTDPYSVFIADLDGDGDNDLAVANNGSGNVSVLLNNGDGTFADKVDYDVGYRPGSVFSADVDGDGDNDLITANWLSGTVSVLLNNGNGTFADRVDYEGDGPLQYSAQI